MFDGTFIPHENDFLLTERNYQHFNSITIQDNFIYLLAPKLRTMKTNGKNTQNDNLSTIFVFDKNFNYLYSIQLPDYFCHSFLLFLTFISNGEIETSLAFNTLL